MKTLKTLLGIFIITAALAMNGRSQVYQFSAPISGSMTMSARDLNGNGSGVVYLNLNSLSETIYLDMPGGTIRQVGAISYTLPDTNIQFQETNDDGVSATVTVNLAPGDNALSFDTGLQPVTWNVFHSSYNAGNTSLTPGFVFYGSCSVVTGGQTYADTFSYTINDNYNDDWCTAFTFGYFSTNGYPSFLQLSGLGVCNVGGTLFQSPGTVANIEAPNGFEVELSPGIEGYWCCNPPGEIFTWSSPPVTATNAAGLPPGTATAIAVLVNDFVVGANMTYWGSGYTNTPAVRIIGGGGSGAQAVAVMCNGMVIDIDVLDAGSGYTNEPLVIIDPPFIPNPVLGIAPMSFLTFSNLAGGSVYQLQQAVEGYWTNQSVNFTAANSVYTQMVPGVMSSGDYRLALNPIPAQAFATPEVVNGFVVGATVTSGGSGYLTNPAVSIVGGGGADAGGVSQISGGVVTGITITNAGIGYTNTPTVEIAPPPPPTVVASTAAQLGMRVDSSGLAPYDNYQIQFTPALGAPWGNWNGGLFTPTDATNSQYLPVTNAGGFFRLQYVP